MITVMPKRATDVSSSLDQEFEKTKGKLFFQKGAGFLGQILAQVNFMWTRDLPTAAISSKMLYWNPDFFESLDQQTRVSVLAHELWHLGLAHGARMGDRCPDKWNEAGDHVINLLLKEHGYYMDGFPYLMDPKYSGLSTEEVYDDLQINPGQPQNNPLGDDIIPAQSQEEIDDAMGKLVTAYTNAKMTCEPGSIPGELDMVIDEFLNPILPWNVILMNFFNAMVEDVYSYARPNRRYEDPLLPGMMGREGLENLMFGADISGSISDDDILRYFSEGKFIHDELQPELMTMVTFDTEIHDVFHIDRDDPFDKFEITGRGGTDLVDLYAMAKRDAVTALVIFTDLCVDIPEDPGFPIIWVVTGNPTATVPYGKLIHCVEPRK